MAAERGLYVLRGWVFYSCISGIFVIVKKPTSNPHLIPVRLKPNSSPRLCGRVQQLF